MSGVVHLIKSVKSKKTLCGLNYIPSRYGLECVIQHGKPEQVNRISMKQHYCSKCVKANQ